MKKKFVIGAIFTVLLMLLVSTVSVITAQTEEAAETIDIEKNITEKESDSCELCLSNTIGEAEESMSDIGGYIKLLLKNKPTDCDSCGSDTASIGWYPGKITICFIVWIVHIILSVIYGNIHWASFVFARTVLGCNWAQVLP